MTDVRLSGVALAVAAASAFEVAYVLQVREARRGVNAARGHVGALASLARRPLWLAALALSGAAFALQVLALQRAPLAVVQPVLASGLVLLLVLSRLVLDERPGLRELAGAFGVMAGVGMVVFAAPQRTGSASVAGLAVSAAVLAAVLACGLLGGASGGARLIAAATAGDVLAALAINQVAGALPDRLLPALAWAALAAAAGALGLAAETGALRRRPASLVAPAVLAGQVAIPVALAPLVAGESWAATPGGGTLVVAGLGLVVASVVSLARGPALGALRLSAADE